MTFGGRGAGKGLMDREALLRTIGEEFEDPYGLHEILWIRTPGQE